MKSFIARFFTALALLCFSFIGNAQENTPIEGTWVLESTKTDSSSKASTYILDSISFTEQNFKYYNPIDSLNANGKFIVQGDFIALYPNKKGLELQKIEITKNIKDTLSLKFQNSEFMFLRKPIKTNAIDIQEPKVTFESTYRGLIGIAFILGIGFLFSANRKKIDWRLVVIGISLQITFAALFILVDEVAMVFKWIADKVVEFLAVSEEGAQFVFGGLVDPSQSLGYIFAFKVLPTIVFFSAFTSLLYYLGILQKIVYAFAWVMSKTMRLSGAESLAAAANIFIGQTEAPLVVKPYLEKMTKSEMLCLMVGGMATIAGGVLAAFIEFLGGTDPESKAIFAQHLITASIMSAPAAIVMAKMLFPETETEKIDRKLDISKEKIGSNVLDAISRGTTDGLKLAVNVGAMLLVFTAIMAVINWFLGDLIGDATGLNELIVEVTEGRYDKLSMQYILGNLFAPIAWIIGVPSDDIVAVGQLLGEKTILNEFFAYKSLSDMKIAGTLVNYRSVVIATYALCGFANFASIGIQIGGIGVLAPGQRKTLAAFGVKALIGGTCAALLTATIAGMLFG